MLRWAKVHPLKAAVLREVRFVELPAFSHGVGHGQAAVSDLHGMPFAAVPVPDTEGEMPLLARLKPVEHEGTALETVSPGPVERPQRRQQRRWHARGYVEGGPDHAGTEALGALLRKGTGG